jgi:K+-sensing histidine kinase KdpD
MNILPLQLTPVSLTVLLRAQLRSAETKADVEGQVISMKVSGDPRAVDLDAACVSDALEKLLSSAIGFNQPQGRVRVNLDFKSAEVLLSVADEGEAKGWDGELTPVARAFEAHGAAVELVREVGGSVFRARLPLPA